MSPIEKHLQGLLELSPDGLPVPFDDTQITEKELFQLVSLGLVEKHDRSDGSWWVNPTDDGIVFFIRKEEARKRTQQEQICTSVVSAAVASAVTVLLQALISHFF